MIIATEIGPFDNKGTDPNYNKPYDLEGVEIVGDQQAFIASLQALELSFAEQHVSVFCDFDKTLAPTNSWSRAAQAFEPESELAKKSKEERIKHLMLQHNEALTPKREDRWTRAEIGRHAVNGTTIDALTDIAAGVTLHPGAKELISLFQSLGLPFRIVSAGHGEFIEAVLESKHINVDPDDIIANRAATPRAKLVNRQNKREHIDAHFPQAPDIPNFSIAIGDALTDAAMGDGLRIRTAQPGGNTPEYLAESEQLFDIVLSTNDLTPLVHLFTQTAQHAGLLSV